MAGERKMTMNFKNSKNEALKQLDFFLSDKIKEYSQKRNFDYGPNKRENVSCLSPYFAHRLINEYDTVKKVLDKFKVIIKSLPPRDAQPKYSKLTNSKYDIYPEQLNRQAEKRRDVSNHSPSLN